MTNSRKQSETDPYPWLRANTRNASAVSSSRSVFTTTSNLPPMAADVGLEGVASPFVRDVVCRALLMGASELRLMALSLVEKAPGREGRG